MDTSLIYYPDELVMAALSLKLGNIMKRHLSDQKYKLLRMLDDFAKSEGLSIKDEIASDKFIDRLLATV